jgi:hypothetical protein
MKVWIIIAVLTLILSSMVMTTMFGFATTYKPEIWATLLLALYGLTKKRNVVINVPKDSIKIITSGGTNALFKEETQKIEAKDKEVKIDKITTQPWKDVKVGEISLEGENYKSE